MIKPNTQEYNDKMRDLMTQLCAHAKPNEMIYVLLIACKIGLHAREPYEAEVKRLEHELSQRPVGLDETGLRRS